jgi:hypothetical protein
MVVFEGPFFGQARGEIKELGACSGEFFISENVRENGYPLGPHIIGFMVCGDSIEISPLVTREMPSTQLVLFV